MAEILSDKTSVRKNTKRLNKKSTRVDLTPMVDLGFLLITFFVFTTTMARPTAMNVVVPNDSDTTTRKPVCSACVLTAVLVEDDKIKYFEGDIANTVIYETSYEGIRNILVNKKRKVREVRGNEKEFVLIIKPSEKSTFKNFVDITDEVTINNISQYFIDEATDREMKLL
ncbi:ExbD/TolR family protein [Ferruginibacter sp. SUN002]|uniref:ExbD/TolR family protein n=1 Tax=Ferruginibacter sp. SUN002 TaxID=2937789 RepID=UPI003D365E6A